MGRQRKSRGKITRSGKSGDSPAERIEKPFIILVNSTEPESEEAQALAEALRETHSAPVMAVNCAKMSSDELNRIIEKVLYQFPVSEISFEFPGFMEGLEPDHWLKASVIETVRSWADSFQNAEDVQKTAGNLADGQIIKSVTVTDMDLGTGQAVLEVKMADGLF